MTKTRPLVSVVIATFNGRSYLEECLPSLRAQTFGAFELIVVDNGSTDGTEEFVKATWPEARRFIHPESLGFARAMNIGMKAAEAPLIVVLNNDVVAEPTWLEELVACMERHPEAGFCSPKMYRYDDPGRLDGAGAALTTAGWAYEVGHGEIDTGQYDQDREVCIASGVSLMLRRAVLEDVGYFDEAFGTICEDTDLTLRAFLAGWPGYFASRSVLRHRRSGTVSRIPEQLVLHYQRNMELVLYKNFSRGLLARGAFMRVAFWIASFARHLRDGYGLLFLRAKLNALRSLPAFRWKRAHNRALRRVHETELRRLMVRPALTLRAGLAGLWRAVPRVGSH